MTEEMTEREISRALLAAAVKASALAPAVRDVVDARLIAADRAMQRGDLALARSYLLEVPRIFWA